MKRVLGCGLVLFLSFFFMACAGKGPPAIALNPTPPPGGPESEAAFEVGKASYYGRGFHNRKTASGERFNMKAMTAAHRTLPLGTIVRVENLENHHFAVVKVNDRGPFIKGRILDLSQGAAKILGFVWQGIAQVKITPLAFPDPLARLLKEREDSTPRAHDSSHTPVFDRGEGRYSIKVASLDDKGIAVHLEKDLRPFFDLARVSPAYVANKTYWRVMIGRYNSKREARGDLAKLKEFGHRGIVRKWRE